MLSKTDLNMIKREIVIKINNVSGYLFVTMLSVVFSLEGGYKL